MENKLFYCKFIVPRHSSKKNEKVARKSGRRLFIGKSEKARFAENWMIQKMIEHRGLQKTIESDVSIKFLFHFPAEVYITKAGTRSKKLNDLSNLVELPADCLQKTGIILNDQQICSLDGSRRLESPDGNYWLEIEISEFVK